MCYAVTIRSGIGLGPLYVLQDGVARQMHISVGRAVMLVGVGLVAVALALRWRPGPGTLALPFIGGASLDALLPHLPTIHGWALRLVAVVTASWIMALGGALMVRAAIGFAAYDGVMLGLHRHLAKPVAPIRLAMEATVLAAGWLLGGAVGVGTVITGLMIGPGMQFWLRVVRAGPTPVDGPAAATLFESALIA